MKKNVCQSLPTRARKKERKHSRHGAARERTRRGSQASERLVLIPAVYKNSTTGYKNVTYDDRSKKKFEAQVRDGGKSV